MVIVKKQERANCVILRVVLRDQKFTVDFQQLR